jgi:hypothetical protein
LDRAPAILFVSAFTDPDLPWDVLAKPFPRDALLGAVSRLLESQDRSGSPSSNSRPAERLIQYQPKPSGTRSRAGPTPKAREGGSCSRSGCDGELAGWRRTCPSKCRPVKGVTGSGPRPHSSNHLPRTVNGCFPASSRRSGGCNHDVLFVLVRVQTRCNAPHGMCLRNIPSCLHASPDHANYDGIWTDSTGF